MENLFNLEKIKNESGIFENQSENPLLSFYRLRAELTTSENIYTIFLIARINLVIKFIL